jgi:hypothetical protein
MHLIHKINPNTFDLPDLKLVSFYSEGPNSEIKMCPSIIFESK